MKLYFLPDIIRIDEKIIHSWIVIIIKMMMSLSRKAKEIYIYMKVNRKEKITHTRKICVHKKKFRPEMKSNRLKHVRMWVEPK